MAGRDGTVTRVQTANGVNTVVVDFPAIPDDLGPPPVPGQLAHTETYTSVDPEEAATFRSAFSGNTKIDTTGTAPACGTVTAHR